MAASDNVLRGGLTPKHIDVDELLRVLDPTPGPIPVVLPVSANGGSRGVESFPAPVSDFELLRARPSDIAPARLTPRGPAIVVATVGEIAVESADGRVVLAPGQAAFASPDTGELRFVGSGEAFIAQPGE